MKKMISVLLVLVMVLAMTACGSASVTEPGEAAYKADVQDYITDVMDATAEITIFEKKGAELNGDTLTVTCVAMHSGEAGDQMSTFILTYVNDGKAWNLDKCRVEQGQENQEDPQEETDPVETEPPTEATEPSDELTLSDDWKDFTFEMMGETYQLPCRYQVFVDNGFVLDVDYSDMTEDSELAGYSRAYAYLTNGAVRFYVDIINLSGNARAIADCDIGGIEIEASDNMGLKLAQDIHCLSTAEEVQAVFGTPSSINTTTDYTSMSYELDDYVEMSFYIYNSNTTYNEISLRNFVADERDATEPCTERPAYLDNYTAPTELSSKADATQFKLDGVIYQLPCPLSTFVDNGWTVSRDSIGYLGAYNSNSGMTLEKDGVKLYVELTNFAKVEMISEHCAVTEVEFQESYLKDVSSSFLKLPSGLKITASLEEIAEACKKFECSEYSSSTTYSASDDSYTWKVSYYMYLDGEKLTVTIKNENWTY